MGIRRVNIWIIDRGYDFLIEYPSPSNYTIDSTQAKPCMTGLRDMLSCKLWNSRVGLLEQT